MSIEAKLNFKKGVMHERIKGLTGEERRVLALLANDCSHEEVTRKLGVFPLYVSRINSQIASKVGAFETEDGVCKVIATEVLRGRIKLEREPTIDLSQLGPIETKVFALMGRGYSKYQIAERLEISLKVASRERTKVARKLGLTTYGVTAAAAHFLREAVMTERV